MIPFWKRKQHDNLTERVMQSLGEQAHEFHVPAIVRDLMKFDFIHEWMFWDVIHKHDSITEQRTV